MTSRKKADDGQRERFIKAARDAGCSEDEAVFDENLKRIAKAGPQHRTPKAEERPASKGSWEQLRLIAQFGEAMIVMASRHPQRAAWKPV